MNRIIRVFAAAVTVMLFVCMAATALADAVFAFEKASYEVNAGKTLKLQPILQGAEVPKGAKYVWSTSDKSIATVSSGTVKGKNGGTVTITCQLQDGKKNVLYETSCEVTVFQAVKKITMNPKQPIIMIVSSKDAPPYTYQLEATVSPSNASNPTLKYTSLSPDLFSVTQDGLVTTKFFAWGGTGYVLIEATDGSGVSVLQEIRCQPFIVTTKEIVMEERGIYRLRVPVAVNSSFWNEFWVPEIIPKNSGYRLEERNEFRCNGYYLESINFNEYRDQLSPGQVSGSNASYCYFDVRPIKAGTYTIELRSGMMWDKNAKCSYTIKLKVRDGAAYSTKTFPELKYKKAMQNPAAMTEQQVYLKGQFIESWQDDDHRWNYVISTGKGESDQVIIRAPSWKPKLDFIKSDKLEVYGAFAEPVEEKTETGLTLYKLVIDAEMINGLCYNTDVHEVDMYDPAEINKKK